MEIMADRFKTGKWPHISPADMAANTNVSVGPAVILISRYTTNVIITNVLLQQISSTRIDADTFVMDRE